MIEFLGIPNINSEPIEELNKSLYLYYRNLNISVIKKLNNIKGFFINKEINHLLSNIYKQSYITRSLIHSIADMITVMKYTKYYLLIMLISTQFAILISNALGGFISDIIVGNHIFQALFLDIIISSLANIILVGLCASYLADKLSGYVNYEEMKQSILMTALCELTGWILWPIFAFTKKITFSNTFCNASFSFLNTVLYGSSNVILSDILYSCIEDIPISLTPDILIAPTIFSILSFARSDYIFNTELIKRVDRLLVDDFDVSSVELDNLSGLGSDITIKLVSYHREYNITHCFEKNKITLRTRDDLNQLSALSSLPTNDGDTHVGLIFNDIVDNEFYFVVVDINLSIVYNRLLIYPRIENTYLPTELFIYLDNLIGCIDDCNVPIEESTLSLYLREIFNFFQKKNNINLFISQDFLLNGNDEEYLITFISFLLFDNNENNKLNILSFKGIYDAISSISIHTHTHFISDQYDDQLRFKLYDRLEKHIEPILQYSESKSIDGFQEQREDEIFTKNDLIHMIQNMYEILSSEDHKFPNNRDMERLLLYRSYKKIFSINIDSVMIYKYLFENTMVLDFIGNIDSFIKYLNLNLTETQIRNIWNKFKLSTITINSLIENVSKSKDIESIPHTQDSIHILKSVESAMSTENKISQINVIRTFYFKGPLNQLDAFIGNKETIIYYYLLNETLTLFQGIRRKIKI